MWLCKSIEKKEKKRGSKRCTSVPTIKTIGTSMPAFYSNEKKRERENKDSPCFPAKNSREGVNFQRAKVELGLSTKYYICTYPPYSIHMHILI